MERSYCQQPLNFFGYDSNPLLTRGAPGSYDGSLLVSPYAQWKDELFYIFYTGNAGICLATSPDGYNFEKYSGNPFFTPSVSGFDSYLVNNGPVFIYYDYGIGENSIGLATAGVWAGADEKRITDYELRITNYPNPINQITTFTYTIKEPGHITIQIFNSFGQIVAEPMNANQSKGDQQVTWNTGNLPVGIYFYCILAGKVVGRGKMVVVK